MKLGELNLLSNFVLFKKIIIFDLLSLLSSVLFSEKLPVLSLKFPLIDTLKTCGSIGGHAGEMTQRLRPLAALSEVLTSIFSKMAQNHLE